MVQPGEVKVCCESCIEDEERPSGRTWSGMSAKQPSATVDKSYRCEQRRKSPGETGYMDSMKMNISEFKTYITR